MIVSGLGAVWIQDTVDVRGLNEDADDRALRCVCVREREREREGEKMWMSIEVCVCEREREGERGRKDVDEH